MMPIKAVLPPPTGQMRLWAAALGLVAAICAPLWPSSGAADSNETIVVGGRARSYVLERPALQGPRPTVFMLHGAGGGPRQFGNLPQLARDVDAVAVVPLGLGGRWNFFPPGRESQKDKQFFEQHGGLPDDVSFLSELAAELVARGTTDPRRIYVVGLSLGGVMALRMACANAGLFAGMAVLVAAMEETAGAECRPAKPLPLLIVHGTADQAIPYAGGQTTRGDSVWPTERLADFFRRLNGCAEAPVRSVATQSPLRIEVESSDGCAGGAVVLYRMVGGAHEVPPALNVGRLVLDFFRGQTAARQPDAAAQTAAATPAPTPLPVQPVRPTTAPAAEPTQLVVDGRARTFVLARPSGQARSPTIIMLHGFGGTGAELARRTGLDQLATRNGFAAVFPDGLRNRWNFFPPGKELPDFIRDSAQVGGVPDDAGFLTLLIAELVRRGISDPRRIYLAGFSNGSFMTLRMMCADTGLFAAIGLLAGGMPDLLAAECSPKTPIAALMINGTNDPTVPYAGGLVQPGNAFTAWPAERLVEFLRMLNGCAGSAEQSVLPSPARNTIEAARWTGCAGAPLSFYRMIGGDHSTPFQFNVGQVLLDFFRDQVAAGGAASSR